MLVYILIIAGAVLLDQASKLLVMNFLNRDEPLVIIKGILRFTYLENDGSAFGMFADKRWVFMIVSVVGIAALLVYLIKFRPDSKLVCVAVSMIIGGGIGNMIDRTFYNGTLPGTMGKKVVVDFIDFYPFPNLWSYIFNIADSFVCVGAGIIMVWCVVSIIKEAKAEKLKKKSVVTAEAKENENGNINQEIGDSRDAVEDAKERSEDVTHGE